MKGQKSSPEAQVKSALTMLSRNIGKVTDGPHVMEALARVHEIRSIVITESWCPTSPTGHPDGCRCRR